ncbi:glycosyltransferase family protein [Pedobacter sp. MC2016-24]|uniref:glycosyltransferase family protein n=1 Tax=Pedobacter sp. MC2016-24 TaxID=2780090 RepID=UPI001881D8A4|nr:glycosyltransferase family protein [Pedobacter sp. MC2016-24]MBE9600362.1 glycosyl transferase [Pedobacter sp. MC2016-24]
MKILYAIQGTGNGHVSRAREIVPLLQQYGDVDLLISGTQADVKLTQEIKYQLHGFSFIFGKKGGVNHLETWKTMDLPQFVKDVRTLPLKDYNLILNDFEPVTAWACRVKGIESVGLSHQASFQSKKVPKPKSIDWAQLVLKYYAPASHYVGFHFDRYDDFIYTPVIRAEIRNMRTSNLGHYTVYLPAIDDRWLVPLLKQVPNVNWQVFSKHTKLSYTDGNVAVSPIHNELFNISLASCAGFLSGGGFEGPAEALFLGKKLLVVPMKFQYEQQCNAFALKQFGLPVIWGSNKNWLPVIKDWVERPQEHQFHFPDETAAVIDKVVKQFAR